MVLIKNKWYNLEQVTFLLLLLLFFNKKNTGKISATQGKHREFHVGKNVATLNIDWVKDQLRSGGSREVQQIFKSDTVTCFVKTCNSSSSWERLATIFQNSVNCGVIDYIKRSMKYIYAY